MSRRSLTEKDGFLEGNRSRWAFVFLACAGALLAAQIFWHIDPTPYLTLITFVGSFLIGGETVTEFVKTKALSAVSTTNTQYVKEEQEIDINLNINESVVEQGSPEAPVVRPFSQIQTLE